MLTAYRPEIFDELDTFEVAREQLGAYEDKLKELGAVIRHYGLDKQVGVSLLHKHFNLSNNERLVEEFVGENSYIKPTTEYSDAIPYMWKVGAHQISGEWVWYPLEFVRPNAVKNTATERYEAVVNNQEFLNAIASKLSELGLTNIFGISLLHREPIPLAKGQILVETTDDDARILQFSAVAKQDVDPTTITQTLWQFPVKKGIEVVGLCGHCTHVTDNMIEVEAVGLCGHCTHAPSNMIEVEPVGLCGHCTHVPTNMIEVEPVGLCGHCTHVPTNMIEVEPVGLCGHCTHVPTNMIEVEPVGLCGHCTH